MSEQKVLDFLDHSGVKGMRWGVRRAEKKRLKSEYKFERSPHDLKVRREILQKAEASANQDFNHLDKRYADKAYNFGGVLPIMPEKYYTEANKILNKHLEKVSSEYTSPSGKRRLTARMDTEDGTGYETLVISTANIEHSIEDGEIRLKLNRDANGYLVIKFPEEMFDLLDADLEQSAMDDAVEVEDFLEHHGIRGMKWGVRKARSAGSRRRNKRETGSPRPSDEGRAAVKILNKQKKHGTVALTNHELRTLTARQKLEQEFEKLNPPPKTKIQKGQDKVKYLLGIYGTAESAYKAYHSPLGKALRSKGAKAMAKKGAKAAMNYKTTVGGGTIT